MADTFSRYETFILLVHGESGVGKSTLAHTAPGPRLVLDAENGSKFYRGPKAYWEDLSQPAPDCEGSVIVQIRSWQEVEEVYSWLNSGKHNFRSVVLDSLTEIQKRCKDTLDRKNGVVTENAWGVLLERMEKVVRDMRDLTMHPVNPLNAVVILALSDEKKGAIRPLIQGGLGLSLPGFVDTVGYYAVRQDDEGNPVRRLLTQPIDNYVAKDRTGVLPITIDNPDVSEMLRMIYRQEGSRNG